MKKLLQEMGWKKSNYEQPQRNYVCGLHSKGEPCSAGPTSKGACPFAGQCKPARSLMSKRRITTVSVAIGTLLFCLILFGVSACRPIVSPGDLTFQHGNLNTDCAACHSSAETGLLNWVTTVPNNSIALSDSKRCINCHQQLGKSPFHPHGKPIDELTELTNLIKTSVGKQPKPPNAALHKNLACSTCHQEHNGKSFNISKLSDTQCQSCHTEQFENFSHGHPNLKEYPYAKRSQIYFDHAKHYQQYFNPSEFKRQMPNGVVPESCNSCHQADASGRFMQTSKFDTMCASCHQDEITDVDYPGIAFFVIPTIQVDQLRNSNENNKHSDLLKRWPSQSNGSVMKTLPPFMELLLRSDPQYQKAVEVLGDSAFSHLTELTTTSPDAVAGYLMSIESLLDDISNLGETAIRNRMGKNYASLSQMKPSIVESIITLNQRRLLISSQDANQLPAGIHSERASASESTKGGGWYIQNNDFSIRYRPTGHSDQLIKTWLEQGVEAGTSTASVLKGSAPDRPMKQFFELLSSPSASGSQQIAGPIASGRCLLCHSVEYNPVTRKNSINWEPFNPMAEVKSLTHFSHKPHLSTGNPEQCTSCHKLSNATTMNDPFYRTEYFKKSQPTAAWTIQTDSTNGLSCGFSAIDKSSCTTCHSKNRAGDSCLKCHNYHAHSK